MNLGLPRRLILIVFITLSVMMGFWWWPKSDVNLPAGHGGKDPGTGILGDGILGALSMTIPAFSAPTTPHAPGLGPVEIKPERAVIPTQQIDKVAARLHAQGVQFAKGDKLQREDWVLQPEVVNHIQKVSNWMPELRKASSTIQIGGNGEPTRLALKYIDADSILWDLGLREGDIIVLIDGEIPQFSPTKALDYIRKAKGALASLDRGEPISLTVLRHQRPVHLVYQALNQE